MFSKSFKTSILYKTNTNIDDINNNFLENYLFKYMLMIFYLIVYDYVN